MLSYFEEIKLKELSEKILGKFFNIIPNFDYISNLLQEKEFIKNNKEFLFILGIKLNEYQIRIFLTSIIIKYCPNDILNSNEELEKKLIEIAIDLLNDYINLLKNPLLCQFQNKINNYFEIFKIWKEKDKQKILFVLSSSYNELNINKKSLNNQIIISEIENQKKELEKSIFKIGGNEAIEKMIDGSFWIDILTPEYKDIINNNLKESFRNKLFQELEENIIPYSIIKCLKEIQIKLDLNNLKIELLNQNLNKTDKLNVINYNLKIITDKINFQENINNEIDILLLVYQKIVK